LPTLLRLAAQQGVERLVFTSTVFAYGYGDLGNGPITEEQPAEDGALLRWHRHLLQVLRAAEFAVLASQFPAGIVLRLGILYGFSVPSTVYVSQALARRRRLIPGAGDGLLPWVEIDDAARAVTAAVVRGQGGETYNVVDDRPQSSKTFAETLAKARGLPGARHVSRGLGRVLAPHALAYLSDTRLPAVNDKARRDLGWMPRHPSIVEGLGLSVSGMGDRRGVECR
jgi:nucleoside-diphosphate-sugar epimerase